MHAHVHLWKDVNFNHTKDFWLRSTRWETRECSSTPELEHFLTFFATLLVGELSFSLPWETSSPPPTPETPNLLCGAVSERLPSHSYRSAWPPAQGGSVRRRRDGAGTLRQRQATDPEPRNCLLVGGGRQELDCYI